MEGQPRLESGRMWDGYVVDSLLGQGASADVYLVQHARRGTWHALKVLRKGDARRRLRVEQEAIFRDELRHPNLVPATEAIDVDGASGLVMDFVEGPTLQRWLHEEPATTRQRLAVLRAVLEGLIYAHGRGVVHRDLKPSNVLMQPEASGEWRPRIGDFGLAKALSPELGRFGGLTTVNTGLGTAGYAAPEQVRDASSVDHRADLYAFGAMLYEATCGIAPFAGLSAFDTLQAQRAARYRPPEELSPGLPPALYPLIHSLLDPDPDRRPSSAVEVADRLDTVLADLEPPAELALTTDADPPTVLPMLALCGIPAGALALGAVVVLAVG